MTELMTKSNKRRLSMALYLNYLVHGIGLIILTQNMQALGAFGTCRLRRFPTLFQGLESGN